MAIDFEANVPVEDRRRVLEARIKEYNRQGYNLLLTLRGLQAANDEVRASHAQATLETLSAIVEAHQAELDSLGS